MADDVVQTNRAWNDKPLNERPVDHVDEVVVDDDVEDQSTSDAAPGAAMGGIGGAVTGAIAGSMTGPGGALLGAAIGGIAGAVASGAAVGAVDLIDHDDAIKGEAPVVTTDAYDTTIAATVDTTTTPPLRTWDANQSTTPAYAGAVTAASRFEDWDSDFRSNWQTNYYGAGSTYEQYEPAYRFGYDLYADPRYTNRDWSEFETEARGDWEYSQPGTWERFKNSIRYGWDRAKNAVTGQRYAA